MTITQEKRAEYETLLSYLDRATGTSLCRESAVAIRELMAVSGSYAAGPGEERERFEAWWMSCDGPALFNGEYIAPGREKDWTYFDPDVDGAWQGWLARAAFSPSSDAGKDDARDAARYRWLRDHPQKHNNGGGAIHFTFAVARNEPNQWCIDTKRGADMDSAIDAALSSLEVIGKGEKG